ncbi:MULTISPECIES: DUF2577 family protein [unclassified Dehalobacter]|uniref:DUF2577 family protein n=1 Tax=unclassified Dehalobacter TaxID=2635733 RepID=UPI001042D7B6|nr:MULTISPECIES: DUF2577 family protein [unclassified Dehalobacter]TCX51921.1 hypothetical protein C1I36_06280 [Dehalobacter sp. 14DCB1]TCX52981.1 hypothetical protein C1I38_07960 [Dehalobacter sp. 12DCB1]
MSDKPTSLKQAFQQMIPEGSGLIRGIVTNASPLSIQIINNPKMVVSGANLVVPRHLTDYETTCTIAAADLHNAAVTIHNALTVGEKVTMLRFSGGKIYYVLDRVVG